jgi:hypothetical protein
MDGAVDPHCSGTSHALSGNLDRLDRVWGVSGSGRAAARPAQTFSCVRGRIMPQYIKKQSICAFEGLRS